MPDRHQLLYTSEERAVLDAYKTQYRETTSSQERKQLAQTTIFPAIFNYWAGQGIEIADPTPRMKVCGISTGIPQSLIYAIGTSVLDAKHLAIQAGEKC